MPVVIPSFASTDSMNAVPCLSPLPRVFIRAMLSFDSLSEVKATHIRPRPCVAMKLIFSSDTQSAAIIRSPSFSRFSSSVTTTSSPRPIAVITSSTGSNIIISSLFNLTEMPYGTILTQKYLFEKTKGR